MAKTQPALQRLVRLLKGEEHASSDSTLLRHVSSIVNLLVKNNTVRVALPTTFVVDLVSILQKHQEALQIVSPLMTAFCQLCCDDAGSHINAIAASKEQFRQLKQVYITAKRCYTKQNAAAKSTKGTKLPANRETEDALKRMQDVIQRIEHRTKSK